MQPVKPLWQEVCVGLRYKMPRNLPVSTANIQSFENYQHIYIYKLY